MRNPILRRLLELFTACLVGYIWGWIIGWSSFDPNLDLWALFAALGALIGLVLGLLGVFRRFGAVPVGSTLGLFSGFWLRAVIFGDRPGLPGLFLALFLAFLAGWLFASPRMKRERDWMPVLAAALYAGFFGGLVIDLLVLDRLLGQVAQHSILTQGIWVMLCGLAGGLVFARRNAHG